MGQGPVRVQRKRSDRIFFCCRKVRGPVVGQQIGANGCIDACDADRRPDALRIDCQGTLEKYTGAAQVFGGRSLVSGGETLKYEVQHIGIAQAFGPARLGQNELGIKRLGEP